MISYSNRLRTTIFPVKSNIFGIPELTSHFQTIVAIPIYEKNVLCSIKGMRDNIDHSQTFTCIIWMFKNFFLRKCLFMVCTGYEGCSHCRKNYTTPFNLVIVLFELYLCYRYIIWWKYTPTCTGRVCKQGCKGASVKSHPRGRGLFSVDISGTSSVKWLYQVSMTYPQLISAAAFFFLPLNTIMSGRCQQVSW